MINKIHEHDQKIPEHVRAVFEAQKAQHHESDIAFLETHISWVVLAGDFAFKFKKPVDFGFLDFSTLEKRKYFCNQELQLNQKFAPELYLEVLSVVLKDGRYHFNGEGEEVDCCLKMVRFDQHDLFDIRLENATFDPSWMDMLAADIAGFHGQAVINSNSEFGHEKYLAEHIQDNLSVVSDRFEKQGKISLEKLREFAEQKLSLKGHLLGYRQDHGFIRQCHGDLHLKNITLYHGKPVAFDCIEFNEVYSVIDVLNDVAFLVMDCDARDRADLGYRFLSRYLEQTGDYAGLPLMQLYLFYRATVRAKVSALMDSHTEQNNSQVRHYLQLAQRYAENRKAALIAVGGLSGSGKSHLALLGCGPEQAIILRSDAIRKQLMKLHPELEPYGKEMTAKTYEKMLVQGREVLNAGFSVILDATFLKKRYRDACREMGEAIGVPVIFYWLDIAPDILKERVRVRDTEKSDVSDANLTVLDAQLTGYRCPDRSEFTDILSCSDIWPRTNGSVPE